MAIIPKSIFLLIIGVVAALFSIALAIPGTAGFYRKDYYVLVDNCPGCGPSEHVTMDISEDAYRIIANPVVVQGHVSIDYVK
ncbi:hypothetical protein H5410_035092 [Solanum commersonii]|uniref:Uncharacterized protein n=1 Tax=Solanum commersonii TaxID=4109 RepID=A0A9J5Y3L2_SOLCO|nr:hypothetical protein H5410_035092 [Solanum commersonii]